MIIEPDGSIHGTVGGGALEHQVMQLAPEVLAARAPRLVHFDLSKDLGMGCGGHVSVFLEPLGVEERLLLFGAGHIGVHLCDMAARCDFAVTVCDDRDALRTPERFPKAVRLSPIGDLEALGQTLGVESGAADVRAVVVTHSHDLDFGLVTALLPLRPAFLGMVGSRRKRGKLDEHLLEKGFDEEAVGQVVCPIGLDIGGQSPAEIATSIVAQLVAHRSGG